MKVAFDVPRNTCYRLYCPLALEFSKQGWEIEFWLFTQQRKGKNFYVPDPEEIPKIDLKNLTVRQFATEEEAIEELQNGKIDLLVGIHGQPWFKRARATGIHTRWLSLQHGMDTFFNHDFEDDEPVDYMAMYSDWWIEIGWEFIKSRFQGNIKVTKEQYLKKMKVVGFPELDPVVSMGKEGLRKRYGIPETSPVVLYLSWHRIHSPHTFWVKYIYCAKSRWEALKNVIEKRRWNLIGDALTDCRDRRVIKKISEFCKKNNALLIVKTRKKTPIKEYLRKEADLIIDDDPSEFPATTLNLLSIASLCIHHFSSGALEAAALGVPGICLGLTSKELVENNPNLARAIDLLYNNKSDSVFNFDGVTRVIHPKNLNIENEKLESIQIKKDKKREYIDRYLMRVDGKCSERIREWMEESLKK